VFLFQKLFTINVGPPDVGLLRMSTEFITIPPP